MASSQVPVSTAGSANETPEIPDNVGDWLRGVYRFATVRNDFWRNSILNLGLFVVGAWLARNLSDIDLMAPQPGMWPNRQMESCAEPEPSKNQPTICTFQVQGPYYYPPGVIQPRVQGTA
nr:mitochondrial import receptor subunit TOM6 homolog [Saimiri boliviensis boliviensis]